MTRRINRRSVPEQKIAVLRAFKAGARSRTHVMYMSNLQWGTTERYLMHFAKIGFLRFAPDGYRNTKRRLNHQYIEDACYLQIVITDKGLIFLNQWDQMHKVLEE